MTKTPYFDFLESAKGFYERGQKLLDPENDDLTIFSGCILLVVGLERLMKHALEARNPLMLLDKASFDDIVAHENGEKMGNRQTISIVMAFARLSKLYPKLKSNKAQISEIIHDRNFLVHQAGYYDLNKIEGKVRVNVAEITEAIIVNCLGKPPDTILGKVVWEDMVRYKKAYKEAEALELNKRISLLKRMHSKGEKLPYDEVEFTDDGHVFDGIECPVCENLAQYEVSLSVERDDEGGLIDGTYFFSLFRCVDCGFVLTDLDEIQIIVGKKPEEVMADFLRDYEPDEEYYYEQMQGR